MTPEELESFESTILKLQDELRVSNQEIHKLKIELATTYSLLENYQVELTILRRRFKKTLDETIETCDALLEEIRK